MINNIFYKVCPSCIDTYTTLLAIYRYSPHRARSDYLQILSPESVTKSILNFDFTFGLDRVNYSTQLDLSFPIRRDLLSNKLPLHSGMGYWTSLTLCRHAFSFFVDNTFISMSDPFSTVWIFIRANSFSSTRSRSQ